MRKFIRRNKMIKDKRGWFQKFWDQTSFAPNYVFNITPEQCRKAIDYLNSLPKKNWRINDLLGKLDMAIGHSTIVNGQSVCTITLDTTEYYMIANVLTPGDVLQYTKTTYTGSTRVNTIINIENKNILFVDGGKNDVGTLIDMASKIITLDATDIGEAAADVLFSGNYGSMLFYREGNYLRNYDDYSKTDTFKNNFITLLKSKDSDTIEVVWNKLFTDYYESNYSQLVLTDSNTYLNTTWDITELELDTENEQTKMNLKRAS